MLGVAVAGRLAAVSVAVLLASVMSPGTTARVQAQLAEFATEAVPDPDGATIGALDVSVAPDGTTLLLWREFESSPERRLAKVQRLAVDGTPLGAQVRIDETADVSEPRLMANSAGGYLAMWRRIGVGGTPIDARRLGATGAAAAPTFNVSPASSAAFGHAVCNVPGRLASWELATPSAKKAATDPVLAAVRAALLLVPGALVGPSTADVCTGTIAVTVPVTSTGGGAKAGKLNLKARAQPYMNEKDTDKLRLTCLPAGS
jgi:hypothetical protein